MPINLQNEQNIATGWGAMPKLDAPSIGGLVEAIMKNRLLRDKMTQESIGDTIKNIQQQRESAAYTDALQKAGLLPEGDYGGLGIKGGTSLAAMIQRKQALEAVEAHRQAVEARIGGRGRSGGGGGDAGYPETTWDEQGREWRRGPSGRWIPVAPVKTQQPPGTPKLSAKEQGWAAPEIPGVSVDVNAPDEPGKFLPPDFTGPPGPPSVPPLLQRPPAETGDALPTSRVIPSDKTGGHADTYGVPPVGTVRGGYRFKGGDPKEESNWEPI